MTSTQTSLYELTQILTPYCNSNNSEFPDLESLENLLSIVSDDQIYGLLSSKRHIYGDTVLKVAAYRGHTELCVTLLLSLPPVDRLKLILVDKLTALHWAAYQGHTETVSGILNCLTADQQLQLLFTQESRGNTALHKAVQYGHTETVKTLLDNLSAKQRLKLLSTQNKKGNTALHDAAQDGDMRTVETLLDKITPEKKLKLLSVQNKEGMTASDSIRTLKQYEKKAEYGVKYRKFAIFT